MATTRDRLVEAGLGVLTTSGPSALNARRIAGEVGSSTMTVYTQFGGMAGLYEAMARESFNRLGRELCDAPRSEDPIADLLTHALVYHGFARADPHRYRLMFGASHPGVGPLVGHEPSPDGGLLRLVEANVAYREVVHHVRTCIDSGRLRAGDAVMITGQMWSVLHGFVMLELAGVFGEDGRGVLEVLAPASINLLVGLGDRPGAAQESAALAWHRFQPGTRPPTGERAQSPGTAPAVLPARSASPASSPPPAEVAHLGSTGRSPGAVRRGRRPAGG